MNVFHYEAWAKPDKYIVGGGHQADSNESDDRKEQVLYITIDYLH